ncbi:MAG: lytic murein transglycosylase [Candidatus Lloydbacteria bacterium]|nr:lytic murein transglycosylase [Candidatus Lloydbacteria bacterium]
MLKKLSFFIGIFVFIAGQAALFGFRAEYVFAADIATTIDARRAQLEADLANLEKEIEGQQAILQSKQRERVSLERDVAILDAQIQEAKLSIRARDIAIEKLRTDIGGKQKLIGTLLDKMEGERRSLAQLVRKTNEVDQYSIVEVALAKENISELFSDIDSLDFLGRALGESLDEIEKTKNLTEGEKHALESKRAEEEELRGIQVLQQHRIEQNEADKKQILNITKGQEAAYQQVIKQKEKSAAAIRSELFTLRGSAAIPFEKALQFAEKARKATGVRAAFILGTIAEESELGANVGSGNWQKDLYQCYQNIGYPTSAEKQKAAFLSITGELGLNPDTMPVSKAPYYGCGGAMGPAQFMPTTWQLYKSSIASRTGHYPPNPWDAEDAFMAAALLLRDNGASGGGYAAERRAALRYLAGGNWQKPSYAFYGEDVMALAEKYQNMIDILQEN